MQRRPKLSGSNEYDIKFIVMFTAAFVVISSVLLLGGYALLSVTGILGQGQAEGTGDPAQVSTVTPRPTYIAIGVSPDPVDPTPTPTPVPPTPTPSPTPVPSPYKIGLVQNQNMAGSMMYNLTFSAVPGYQPVDMTRVRLVINDWETTYCDYDYNAMMYYLDGYWFNDNGDKRLDPTGESLTFTVSAYSLDIPLTRETRVTLLLDGTQIFNSPLPAFQNDYDFGESPDPGSSSYEYGTPSGGSGTSGDPWISESQFPG